MMTTCVVYHFNYGRDFPREALYEVPICTRCQHGACPCCTSPEVGSWCDENGCECVDCRREPGEKVAELGPYYGMDDPPYPREEER
jgi:hypothetical protein